MKKSTLSDIIFIVICLVIILPLIELGYSGVISNYSLVFMMAAYFAGKYVKGAEIKKGSN